MATPLSPDPFMVSSGMRTGDPPADAVMALDPMSASTNAAIREARKRSDVMKPFLGAFGRSKVCEKYEE